MFKLILSVTCLFFLSSTIALAAVEASKSPVGITLDASQKVIKPKGKAYVTRPLSEKEIKAALREAIIEKQRRAAGKKPKPERASTETAEATEASQTDTAKTETQPHTANTETADRSVPPAATAKPAARPAQAESKDEDLDSWDSGIGQVGGIGKVGNN